MHGRLDLPELEALHDRVTDVPLVSISDAQREPAPRANWVATVYHGIPLDTLSLNPKRGDYLAFLGRISPEKGLDTAIDVARRAGLPIKIAARKPLEVGGITAVTLGLLGHVGIVLWVKEKPCRP